MTIEEQKVNEAFLDADILRQIEKLSIRSTATCYKDMRMSDAFANEDSDNEDIDYEDICGVEEEDEKQKPF